MAHETQKTSNSNVPFPDDGRPVLLLKGGQESNKRNTDDAKFTQKVTSIRGVWTDGLSIIHYPMSINIPVSTWFHSLSAKLGTIH